MSRWSSLSKLAWAASLIGVAACGAGPQSRPNTPQSSQSSSGQYGSTTSKPKDTTMKDEQVTIVEQVLRDMEAAFSRNDIEGVVALFAQDATIESYMVSRVFNRKEGVCHGRDEIRELVRTLMKRGKPWGGHGPPIVRGDTAAIEYTNASSDAEKFSVDIVEVRDGKVQSLRAYAGWRAVMAVTGAARD